MKNFLFFIIAFSLYNIGSAQIIKKRLPQKVVVLTFDDAVVSQFNYVAPLLKEYGFNATFFICEFPKVFSDTTKYMTWDKVGALNKMGFEIANHTKTHAHVNSISKEKVIEELDYIDKQCAELGIDKTISFAYPGYGLNQKAFKVLNQYEFQFARGGGSRPYDPIVDHPLLIPSWATNAENKDVIMDAFTQAERGKIIVLTIHGVPDYDHPWVTTPPELFKEYIQYLDDHKFKVLSLKDLTRYIDVIKAKEVISPDFTKTLKN